MVNLDINNQETFKMEGLDDLFNVVFIVLTDDEITCIVENLRNREKFPGIPNFLYSESVELRLFRFQ